MNSKTFLKIATIMNSNNFRKSFKLRDYQVKKIIIYSGNLNPLIILLEISMDNNNIMIKVKINPYREL